MALSRADCPYPYAAPQSATQLLIELTLCYLLIGLATVVALLTLLVVCCVCWRCGRTRRTKSANRQSLKEAFGAPEHQLGNKSEPGTPLYFISPALERNGNGLKPHANHFTHGSPLPPVEGSHYLDVPLDGPMSVVVLDGSNGPKEAQPANGMLQMANGQHSSRKDSVRPMDSTEITGRMQQWSLKNRPFTIVVNDEEKPETDEKSKEVERPKLVTPPRESSPRKFTAKMERLAETDNERLYAEFDALNEAFSCTSLQPRTAAAELPDNIRKNRYFDVMPFDFNRVKLRWTSAYGGTHAKGDFINASFIRCDETGPVHYIAAQGPIGAGEAADGRRVETLRDFWELIWQENIDCIVMLTQCTEAGRQKCAEYWPEAPGESVQIGSDFSLHLYCVTDDDICIQRELWLQQAGQPRRKLFQWHFKQWNDAARPQEVENLLEFANNVRASTKRRPILVHCSAGVGRTGVFIALDILLDKLSKDQLIDVRQVVSGVRAQRTSMVQNAEQYVALYETIALAIRRKCRSSG